MLYVCVCMCACVHVCMCARVCVCVCVCIRGQGPHAPQHRKQRLPLFMCSPLFNVLSTSRMERLNFRIEATARAPESARRLSFTRIAYIHVEYVLRICGMCSISMLYARTHSRLLPLIDTGYNGGGYVDL
jgi:hypothetical protein